MSEPRRLKSPEKKNYKTKLILLQKSLYVKYNNCMLAFNQIENQV